MLSANEREVYLRDGYLVVPDLFGELEARAALNALELEVERLVELNHHNQSHVYETLTPQSLSALPAARTDLAAFDSIRTTWPLTRAVRDLLLGERMRALAKELLSDKDTGETTVVVFNEQYIVKPPRSGSRGAFGWHRDSDSLLKETGENATPYLSVWVAIDAATCENGCLVVRPLHPPLPGLADEVSLEVAAGTAIIMSNMLEHASGPNTTKFSRRAWMAQFSARPITHPSTNTPVSLALPFPAK